MTVMVFVGPTLRREDVLAVLDAQCLPPAAQGDVYRAALQRPRALGVIDGYFAGHPSVWHKEILWAIAQGVPVFGSASMGALRAAELHAYGMRGVGRIFEAYADGTLEDDDEVAVVHGPADIGYLPLSEPMVNVRATLARAEAEGIVAADSRLALAELAKSIHFADRTWETLLAKADALGLEDTGSLRDWLPTGAVDQKRLDGLEMLAAIRNVEPRPAEFRFERTHLWDEFVARFSGEAAPSPVAASAILDELRLEGPDRYRPIELRALLRATAAVDAGRETPASGQDLRRALRELRAERGLFARADLDGWMSENELDESLLQRLLEGELSVGAMKDRMQRGLAPYLLDELRLSGDYPRLAERARSKRAALGDAAPPVIAAARLWYFERRLGRPVPDNLASFARLLGYADMVEFDAAINREWQYSQERRS